MTESLQCVTKSKRTLRETTFRLLETIEYGKSQILIRKGSTDDYWVYLEQNTAPEVP